MWCDAFRASPAEGWSRWDAAFRAANIAVPGTAAGAEGVLESPAVQQLMAAACDPQKLAAFSDAAGRVLSSRPPTLIHGDCRGDNLFRKDGTDDVRRIARPCSSAFRSLYSLALPSSVSEAERDVSYPGMALSGGQVFAFIDFQMMAAGTPGAELVQLLTGNFPNLDDFDRLEEVVADFHAKLVAAGPDCLASDYSSEDLMEDFRISTILFFLGVVGQLHPTLEALCPVPGEAKHPLWALFGAWFPRMGRCLQQVKCAELFGEMVATVEEGVPPADASAK